MHFILTFCPTMAQVYLNL